MQIGQINTVRVLRHTTPGMYVADNDGNEILVPKKYVAETYEPDTLLDFFIYKDSEDRLVATTEKPLLYCNQAGFLAVKEKTKFGYFLDWGIGKDVLLPMSEVSENMEPGRQVLVYLYEDKATKRIVATANVRKFIKNTSLQINIKDKVECLVYDKNEVGYLTIINHTHFGILYFTEVFQKIKRGETLTAYIKKIREDNKVDLVLQKPGFDTIEQDVKEKIYQRLLLEKTIPLSDDSSPEEIQSYFGISKKSFKKAIGMLFKEHKILLTGYSIELNDNDNS